MRPGLTIIIPCYNCKDTLEVAFNSCLNQGVTNLEIVMVNDASTDGTLELMKKLSDGRDFVKIDSNEKNMGGGATRNRAVSISKNDIIFCLDSDDILPPNTMSKMLDMMIEKKADGVGIHRSIKFRGDNIKDVAFTNIFGYVGEIVPFESLIEKPGQPMCPLYSTFMFTKRAFGITGGYPERHGFDTQGFAWRFLANNLTAYTCPDTEYLHRIDYKKSYYIREYESGKINHNWFMVIEEYLFLFSRRIQDLILDFNPNNPNDGLLDVIKRQESIFKENYRQLIREKGDNLYEKEINQSASISIGDMYWLGARYFHRKEFQAAFAIFEKLLGMGVKNGYAHYYLKESSIKTGKNSNLFDENLIKKVMSLKTQGSRVNIFVRIFRKAFRTIKKIIKRRR